MPALEVLLNKLSALACYSWVLLRVFDARCPRWADMVALVAAMVLVLTVWL
jgi:hypothetical protein